MRAIGDFDVRLGVGAPTPFGSGEEADYLLRGVEKGLSARYFPSPRGLPRPGRGGV